MWGQSGKHWYFNIDEDNLALRGYDPVSYFQNGAEGQPTDEPALGKGELTYQYEEVNYRFATPENRSAFINDPESYIPKFGGWCAYRLAQIPEEEGWGQSRIPAYPLNYRIIDGALYLFSKSSQGNARDLWEAHELPIMLKRANDFWESRKELAALVSEKPEGLNANARMENLLWDRFMGKWDGKGHQMIDTVQRTYSDFSPATWTFYYGYDGFCIQDDWKTELNFGGTWNGPAIRGYDPLKEEWHMTFIPINAGRSATWMMTGKFNSEKELEGFFDGTDWQGRPFQQRIYFYDISENHFSWKADRSYDGGKTWIKKFTYTECDRIETD